MENVRIDFLAGNKLSEKIITMLKETMEDSYIRTKFVGFPKLKNVLFIHSYVVFDQHFIDWCRYNRILSVMADLDYPRGAGIEESTALVVLPKGTTVVGEGQVLVFRRPAEYTMKNDKIGFRNMNLSAYLEGDTFQLN